MGAGLVGEGVKPRKGPLPSKLKEEGILPNINTKFKNIVK
jgi:hypothetical protein